MLQSLLPSEDDGLTVDKNSLISSWIQDSIYWWFLLSGRGIQDVTLGTILLFFYLDNVIGELNYFQQVDGFPAS